ncbi:phosphatidate cytidylyltransferase [Chryseobacterium sp. H1D6B]|nr:phosphatidate cytidylyltransferase [Chryseobacterium sp. H1D6B]
MNVVVAWICFQCFFEFLRLSKINTSRIFPSVFLGTAQFFLLNFLNYKNYFLCSTALAFIIVSYFLIIKVPVKQLSGILTALLVCLFAFPHLSFIRNFSSANISNISLIIFVVVVTELNDVFQYLMGKFFGKHKIVPAISPNKTLEGFIGGVLLTVLLSNILGFFLLKSSFTASTLIGAALGISGFCGDVFMSYLKRKSGIKDTGNLLPGHGGLLDRMDSLIFNAPLFFWLIPLFLKN